MNVLEIKQTTAINSDLRKEIKELWETIFPYGICDKDLNKTIEELVRLYNSEQSPKVTEMLPILLEKYELGE